uniref:Uncharacterized protein n=1 Tax=Molossus molossus TaxID=27622 RepID=A0A7J8GKY4_MOLMO|nr:hypothetical protein HJG59_011507 [Molossus molossus]
MVLKNWPFTSLNYFLKTAPGHYHFFILKVRKHSDTENQHYFQYYFANFGFIPGKLNYQISSTNTFEYSFFFFFFMLTREYLFIYLQIGREGERERKKHQCKRDTLTGCLPHDPDQGQEPNLN